MTAGQGAARPRRAGLPPWLACCGLVLALGCASRATPGRGESPGRPGAGGASSEATGTLHYRIRYVPPPEDVLQVRVERSPTAPREFLFTQPGPVARVSVERAGGKRELWALDDEGQVSLPADARAFFYAYPLGEVVAARGGDLRRGAGSVGTARHVSGRAYLMRPRVIAPRVSVLLDVEGTTAHLPWAPGEDGRYRLGTADLVDSGFHVFGAKVCTLEVGQGRIEVARLDLPTRNPPEGLCRWVEQAARDVLTVVERYPFPRTLVSLIPVEGSRVASPFGMLLWSTPPSLAIYVGAEAPPSAFAKDWVATHELLHQLHPSFLGEAPWLSEGIATYYTEVSRMRSGRLTQVEGWEELLEGFERGAAQAQGRGMDEAVRALHAGVYLPTYWAGALLVMELDLLLRERTQGTASLDTVLQHFAGKVLTATLEDFGAQVDRVAGGPLFDATLAAHREGPALARAGMLLEGLGVRRVRGRVVLGPGPRAALRDAVSARRHSTPAP